MSDVAAAAAAALLSSASVTALVGQRVWPQWAKQADVVYPYCIYNIDGVTPIGTYSSGTNSLRSCTLSVACIAKTYGQAVGVSEAVLSTLDNADGVFGGVSVQGIFLNDDGISDDVLTESESETLVVQIRTLSFLVWYVASE